MASPLVAIVGAPNVGKSTLFNRLTRRRNAIVTDEPGVTRDRQYGVVADAEAGFHLVDTGGLISDVTAPYAREIEQQAAAALDEASLVLFVVDAAAGLTAQDREVSTMLRRRGLPVVVVANKIDAPGHEARALELHELGFGDPVAVSAEHARGIGELLDCIAALLPPAPLPEAPAETEAALGPLRIALVGRPNVGKSSLVNRLVGQERVVVSELPGTTRDSIDTLVELDGRRYVLIDTAGIRRRGRIERGVERFSVARARRNIEDCDVAVVVLDGSQELAAQDAHITGFVQQATKPMLVVVNKWDIVTDREAAAKRWEEVVRHRLRFAKEVPILLASALTGQRVPRLLDEVDELHRLSGLRVSTPELNRWLSDAVGHQRAPKGSVRFYYATQIGVHPPHFVLFCNDPRRVHFSQRRRLENSLRDRFGFGGAALRLQLRGRSRRDPR